MEQSNEEINTITRKTFLYMLIIIVTVALIFWYFVRRPDYTFPFFNRKRNIPNQLPVVTTIVLPTLNTSAPVTIPEQPIYNIINSTPVSQQQYVQPISTPSSEQPIIPPAPLISGIAAPFNIVGNDASSVGLSFSSTCALRQNNCNADYRLAYMVNGVVGPGSNLTINPTDSNQGLTDPALLFIFSDPNTIPAGALAVLQGKSNNTSGIWYTCNVQPVPLDPRPISVKFTGDTATFGPNLTLIAPIQ